MQSDYGISLNRDSKQISDMKLRHNKECKGLMVQIRYLKAKFTRESSFRDDLTWQKNYLMTLLAQFKRRLVQFLPSVL